MRDQKTEPEDQPVVVEPDLRDPVHPGAPLRALVARGDQVVAADRATGRERADRLLAVRALADPPRHAAIMDARS